MRVLHLIKTSQGAAWALRQIRELVRLGIEVHVAVPYGGDFFKQYEQVGAIVHAESMDFPMGKPWCWPRIIQRMRKLVLDVQPDLIHSHHVGTTVTMRLALRGKRDIKRIFQVPGPLHLEHAFFRSAEMCLAGADDYWIGSCQYTCDLYRKLGIPGNRLFLSYYGVDLEQFVCRKPGKLRRELGLDQEAKLVGMVAYIYAPKRYLFQTRGLKGHEDLIDALSLIQKKETNVIGVFVGGAWDRAHGYEKKVKAYGHRKCGNRVVFLGTRRDVLDLYPDLNVAVHPSHSENVGGAVESLLMGVPTIATNVGGLPEVVRPGETGWLVSAKNPEDLAEAILEALANPGRGYKMASAGKYLVSRLFDVRRTTCEVAQYYRQILA